MSTVTISMRLPRAEGEPAGAMRPRHGDGTADVLETRAGARGAGSDIRAGVPGLPAGRGDTSRAAEIAGLSLRDMILRMRGADLELNYGVEDLEKDLRP